LYKINPDNTISFIKVLSSVYNIETIALENTIISEHPRVQELSFGLALSFYGGFEKAFEFIYNKST
jgi:hypothetical protein